MPRLQRELRRVGGFDESLGLFDERSIDARPPGGLSHDALGQAEFEEGGAHLAGGVAPVVDADGASLGVEGGADVVLQGEVRPGSVRGRRPSSLGFR